jgi:hypothetical protein
VWDSAKAAPDINAVAAVASSNLFILTLPLVFLFWTED